MRPPKEHPPRVAFSLVVLACCTHVGLVPRPENDVAAVVVGQVVNHGGQLELTQTIELELTQTIERKAPAALPNPSRRW